MNYAQKSASGDAKLTQLRVPEVNILEGLCSVGT